MEEKVFLNLTFARPTHFYINGFYDFPQGIYFFILICFIYIMTVLGNVVLLSIILLARALHTPKYIIVFNLALTDLCGSTALLPKLLDTFLFENRYIAYNTCLSYLFFVSLFSSIQSWTLVLMAFDRFVAICFPFYYHSIVTKPVAVMMLVFVWLMAAAIIAAVAGLVNRLSFCNSIVIQSFYCDHAALYQIACSSTLVNKQVADFGGAVLYIFPLTLIGGSYVSIAVALKRTVSRGDRYKALKTCSSHLILVAIFFIPLFAMNIARFLPKYHAKTRMINATLSQTLPSLLNPFVYSLKTDEVLMVIKNLFRKNIPTKNSATVAL